MTTEKPRILAVDDDEMVLQSTVRVLHREFEVVALLRAREAVELVKSQSFAAIVSDVSMPGMNGFEMRDAICKIAPTMEGKFVFVSGGGDTPALRELLQTNAYLTKPVSPAVLVSALRKITG